MRLRRMRLPCNDWSRMRRWNKRLSTTKKKRAVKDANDKMKQSIKSADEKMRWAIEAHAAAMQRAGEHEKKEREVIQDKKEKAIRATDKKLKLTIKADENVRKAIEAAQEATDKATKTAEIESIAVLRSIEQKLAATQMDFVQLPFLRQVYHEAPDDVFELILSKCSDIDISGWGMGGLNAFRLANKQLKHVSDSCTTRLAKRQVEDGQEPDGSSILPIPIIQKSRRVEEIRCQIRNLRSLEGCPCRLKQLDIGYAPHLSDLSSLASCSTMTSLVIWDSSITDISVITSMPLLEMFVCEKRSGRPSIQEFSPLSSCPMLITLYIGGNRELKDLSPLSACTALETLIINDCPLIISLAPLAFLKNLEDLDCYGCPLITSLEPLSYLKSLKEIYCYGCPLVTSLAPLSTLYNLEKLVCYGIDPQTSVLPLASCRRMEDLECSEGSVGLQELRRRRPMLRVTEHKIDLR